MAKGKEQGADVLVVIDADGQHDARDIPRLVQPVLNGEADVVIGSRFLARQRDPHVSQDGAAGAECRHQRGIGAQAERLSERLPAYSARAMDLLTSPRTACPSAPRCSSPWPTRLKVAEIPIEVCYVEKSKRNPVGHEFSVPNRVLVLISLRQPFILFGIPGVALLAGFVLGMRVLNIYGEKQELALGTLLGAVLLALTGILALFTALMLQAMKELLRGQWERFEKSEEAELGEGGGSQD